MCYAKLVTLASGNKSHAPSMSANTIVGRDIQPPPQLRASGLSFFRLVWYSPHMVVRMRHTRAHTANRRSHHALRAKTLAACECGAVRVSHRACAQCGRYRGRVVIDVAAKAKRRARKATVEGKAAK